MRLRLGYIILQKNLLGLDSTDVRLAVLDERIAVDVSSDLFEEGIEVSGELRALVGVVREGSDSTCGKSSTLRHVVLSEEVREFIILERGVLILEDSISDHLDIRIVQEISG